MIYFSIAILILTFLFGLNMSLKRKYSRIIEIFLAVLLFGTLGTGVWFLSWKAEALLILLTIIALPTIGFVGRHCAGLIILSGRILGKSIQKKSNLVQIGLSCVFYIVVIFFIFRLLT